MSFKKILRFELFCLNIASNNSVSSNMDHTVLLRHIINKEIVFLGGSAINFFNVCNFFTYESYVQEGGGGGGYKKERK